MGDASQFNHSFRANRRARKKTMAGFVSIQALTHAMHKPKQSRGPGKR
jgi:hypothetical protein